MRLRTRLWCFWWEHLGGYEWAEWRRTRLGPVVCRARGHRWHLWTFYSGGSYPLFGGGVAMCERGEMRHCSRCPEAQYRNVEWDERTLPPPLLQWREPADPDEAW